MKRDLRIINKEIGVVVRSATGREIPARDLLMADILRIIFEFELGSSDAKMTAFYLRNFLNGVHLCSKKKGFRVMPIPNCMMKKRKSKEDPPDINCLKGPAFLAAYALMQSGAKIKVLSRKRKNFYLVCWV